MKGPVDPQDRRGAARPQALLAAQADASVRRRLARANAEVRLERPEQAAAPAQAARQVRADVDVMSTLGKMLDLLILETLF